MCIFSPSILTALLLFGSVYTHSSLNLHSSSFFFSFLFFLFVALFCQLLCLSLAAHTPDNSFMGFVAEELNETERLNIQRNKVNNMAVVYGKEASMWKVGVTQTKRERKKKLLRTQNAFQTFLLHISCSFHKLHHVFFKVFMMMITVTTDTCML